MLIVQILHKMMQTLDLQIWMENHLQCSCRRARQKFQMPAQYAAAGCMIGCLKAAAWHVSRQCQLVALQAMQQQQQQQRQLSCHHQLDRQMLAMHLIWELKMTTAIMAARSQAVEPQQHQQQQQMC
jgi:hypothetical protein